MKAHTSDFKNALKGMVVDKVIITYGNTILGTDEIIDVEFYYEGSLLKTMMKGLTITSTEDIAKDTVINFKYSLYIEKQPPAVSGYEDLDFGNYVVVSSEKNEDSNTYTITCYDKLIYSAVDYVDLNLTYPITLGNYLSAICTHLGLTLSTSTFTNSTMEIPSELYLDLGYKFRDVLDEISQATGTSICLNSDDEVELRVPTATNDTIDEDFISDLTTKFKEKYGPINTLVLSRSADSDSIYYPSTLPENPVEIKISDNQILNGNNRADYMAGIASNVFGIEFYQNDFTSPGIFYYDFLDKYNVSIDGTTYNCIMFNDDISIASKTETIHSDIPQFSETDYSKASTTDKTLNRALLIVDKVKGEIDALVESTQDLTDYINVLEDDSELTLTNTMTSNGAINYIEITNFSELNKYPGLEYPNDYSYPGKTTTYTLVFTDSNNNTKECYLTIGVSLISTDKIIVKQDSIEVIRLNQIITLDRKNVMYTFDETTKISLKAESGVHIKCEYIVKNDFTTQFALQGELGASVIITDSEITTKVSKAEVISTINQSAEQVSINANKISLEGIITANENFKVNLDGSIEAKNGKFSGIIDGGQIMVNGDNYDDENLPYFEIYTTKPNEFSSIETAGVRQWAVGISAYNYSNNNYNEPVIRTETSDGYAELEGTQVNAFGFNNVSLEEKKKNFEKLENAISIIKETSIYKFNYKGEKDSYKKHIGLVIGDNYSYSKDLTNNENNAVDLYSMVGVCFKAIQEQQQIIENLQKEMEEIRNGKN